MKRSQLALTRLLAAAGLLLGLGACTNGINAGVDGGVAFIVLAGTLIFMCVVLWFILGRED
jgi:hypothetical protein